MKLIPQSPKKALKAFLKQKPLRSEIDIFKTNLIALLDKIGMIEERPTDESEEHLKNDLRDFLRDTWYRDTNAINTKDRKDLVIHLGKTTNSEAGVIIEAKRPTNISEMVSAENPNRKALHELIFYYLDERNKVGNIQLKNLVITNVNEWYIIDANNFDKHIYRNTQIRKLYETKINDHKDNPFFYEEIARIIQKSDIEIPCVCFDIREYYTILRNNSKEGDKELSALFKILSPQHLLKIASPNDSNSLNEKFYKELLHIIGLEEAKEGTKNIIRRKVGLPAGQAGNRNVASLIELVIEAITTENSLHRLPDASIYGTTREEKVFNIALELCITWINRILFLKLLEGQLVAYHKSSSSFGEGRKGEADYLFLNTETIHDFDELFKLFHKVLAVNLNDRTEAIKSKYSRIPYLNSSLFDISELEDQIIKINSLDNAGQLELIHTTILKDIKKTTNRLPTLDYLFKFLDAYDFASEGNEAVQEDNKNIINASVLGKVFEKINGYKDGSIFTPGFITMYMCRKSIRLAVIQKFREKYGWNIETFDDIKNYLTDRRSAKDILEFNTVINSLRICDPAVGSGHFLVSSLNELIVIKYELGLLADSTGNRIRDYEIEVISDELIITDDNGNAFEYTIVNGKPKSNEIQRLQKTLFHEKQSIIENCLFGVDINPNSVKICRLRLWIELLKNAYYLTLPCGTDLSSSQAGPQSPLQFGEGQEERLETLPNIDINIKCGNSLISRFALDADLSKALKSIKYDIKAYRGFVNDYKNEKNRDVKRGLQKIIDGIKGDFRSKIDDPFKGKIAKARGEVELIMNDMHNWLQMGEKVPKAMKEKLEKAAGNLAKLEAEKEAILNNIIYKNAFEWRFEFPEVLNNNGDFEGFDLIIGNPPYISNWDLSESNRPLVLFLEQEYSPYLNGHWDLFGCFIYKGVQLLKKNGINTFILPTSFYKEKHSTELRKYFIENVQILELIDFKEAVVFEGIARQTGIYLIERKFVEKNEINVKFSIEAKGINIPQAFFSQLKNNAFKTNVSDLDIGIHNKLLTDSILLGNILCMNTGVVAHSKIDSPIKFTKDDVIHKEFQEGFKKYIVGSNISQYNIIFNNEFMDYETKKEYFHRPKFPLLFESEKLIVRRISGSNNKFMSCYDDKGYYTNDNVMHLVLWNKEILKFQKPEKKWDCIVDSNLSLKYLLAIINSNLNTYFFSKFLSTDTLQGTYSSIYPEDIRQIPIRNISYKDQQPFIDLVDNILEAKQQGHDTTRYEQEIDEMVYKLYELTEDEIKILEGK